MKSCLDTLLRKPGYQLDIWSCDLGVEEVRAEVWEKALQSLVTFGSKWVGEKPNVCQLIRVMAPATSLLNIVCVIGCGNVAQLARQVSHHGITRYRRSHLVSEMGYEGEDRRLCSSDDSSSRQEGKIWTPLFRSPRSNADWPDAIRNQDREVCWGYGASGANDVVYVIDGRTIS